MYYWKIANITRRISICLDESLDERLLCSIFKTKENLLKKIRIAGCEKLSVTWFFLWDSLKTTNTFLKDEIFHIRSKYLKWFLQNKLDSVHQRGMGHVDDKSQQRLQSIKKQSDFRPFGKKDQMVLVSMNKVQYYIL